VVNCVDAKKRQAEIGETLQQAEKLSLISNDTYEYRVPAVADQGHTFEQGAELVRQLTFGFEPIHSGSHGPNFCIFASRFS
jgi:hypothetical protein